jgi:Major Facilitator Superfamily
MVPFLILAGLGLLAALVSWEERRDRLGLDQLVDTTLLRIPRLRAGLLTLSGQQLVLMGTFFVLPVYLQIVLGFDAFETGKRLLPLSGAMLVAALSGPRIAGRLSPRTVAQLGLVSISAGAVVMLATLDVNLNDTGFKIALILMGIGAGLLASQLGNVIMSSVDASKTSETGGLQGTALNLGASIGTALIGAVLIVGLINGFNSRIADNQDLPQSVRQTIAANTEEGIDIVPVSEVKQRALSKGLPSDQADEIASAYGDAQLEALKKSLGAVAVVALLSLWFTRRLPSTGATQEGRPEQVEAQAAA